MNCDVAREALSARIDGEREPVPAARVDEHLADCPDCRGWHARAAEQASALRALAGIDAPAVSAVSPGAAPVIRRVPVLRVALGVVGGVQLGLAALQGVSGDLGLGHGGGHLLNESTAWSAAVGAAMLLAAWRPVFAAGVAAVLGFFTLLLSGYVVADALAGDVGVARALSHLPVLVGAVLAALVWRASRADRPSGSVLADVVLPESAATPRRLREAG
ncbi:zf-HC2 domain-containing protein [Mycolicibacterium brumae]|uniref:Putative zinc-finger domain-containing protein n=1 Tax=Mycolicibacterium brumae TaxID=85968 RepID=A0A2G5P6S8_9MYCO|nr:zf-HC2 domain-containing protein [Mycolicibacterium brumae]MCV7194213.1 zf-HC2 domain-containing protein [Mycolicibacterium brumae]PIB74081.1 hypothetical protein CQY22_014215 [Mycolicibacterium brumae]RWA19427.1 hypothetical protein MBRU_16880 [Mycolicibacterium brumae DSM 44177]UWW08381.1 zf-HC2 domain-containing protein [Mycolicibacterium brumae]